MEMRKDAEYYCMVHAKEQKLDDRGAFSMMWYVWRLHSGMVFLILRSAVQINVDAGFLHVVREHAATWLLYVV